MKLNILHFSDLHYEKKYNTKLTLLRDKMIESIQQLKDIKIDVVIFSGDLVQAPSMTSFQDAYNDFILPLLDKKKDKLCLTIGNHDVITNNRNKLNFSGLKDYVIQQQDKHTIHDLVEDNIEMNEFKDFNNFVEGLNLENLKEAYTNYSIYEYTVDTNLTLGIVSLNSSIFMEGSRNDYGNLYFVSDILLEAAKKISNCTIKAVNIHHSFGWFQNPKELEKILLEKFNLVFFGHEHEHDAKYVLDFNNRDIVNFHAPSIFHNKNPKNGFAIYSFDIDCDSISINNFIYNDKDKLFENIEQKNIENINITSKISKAIRNLSICSKMYPIVKEKINKYLTINLTSEVNKKDIEDVYVYQKIIEKNSNDENTTEYTLEDIIQQEKNILLTGKEEGGKSTTLNMITLQCLKTHTELIPIYIPSSELMNQKSLRLFDAFIAEYLDRNYGNNKFKIHKMQLEKRFIFLIDDIDLLSTELFNEIKSLNNRIIATTVEQKNVEDVIQQDLTQLGTKKEDMFSSFLKLELKNFRKKDRKKLASNIAPSDMSSKISNSINKTIIDFKLPPTPFITTLLIWMHTQNIDIRNNKPEIVDVFLDYLLEKAELSIQFKGKFNFADKKELLANIAYEFFTMESFAIKEDVILKCIINYVTKFGFDINSSEILRYFLDRKIFIKNNNIIMFSYKVFYYYFMSLYMVNNRSFTEKVMKDKKLLLNMIEELKFYSAIKTDDNIFVEHLIDAINNSHYKKKFKNNSPEQIKLIQKNDTTERCQLDILLDTNKDTQNNNEVDEESYEKLSDIIDDKRTDEHEKKVVIYNTEQNNPIRYHQRYYKEEFLVLNTILSEFVKNLTTIAKEEKCKYLDFAINNYAMYFQFWEFLYKNDILLKRFISINYNVSKEKLEDKEFSKAIELIKIHTLNIITELTDESLATPKLSKIYSNNISHENNLHNFFLYTIIEISINENNLEELLNQLLHNSNNKNIFQILYTTISYNYYDKDYTSKTKKILKNILIKLHLIKVYGKEAITDKKNIMHFFQELDMMLKNI